MSTAIQTIPSFSVFDHGDRFSLVYTKLLHMTNRGLLPFNLLRSASFASYHLPDASRFTYGHGHPIEYDDSRFFCLLLFLYEFFFIPLIFILLSLLFFFRTRITRIFVRCVTRLAIGVRCIASIIVLHVFAIAKSITCHKCVVAAHFEALCETCLIMVNV